MPGMQLNPNQATEIKTEQPKPPMQIIRTPNITQTFITQSLPTNNANMGISMDQSVPAAPIDDSLNNVSTLTASTSYNQKDSERKRQDERTLIILEPFAQLNALIFIVWYIYSTWHKGNHLVNLVCKS